MTTHWNYISAIYCVKLNQGLKLHQNECDICDTFIAVGEKQLKEKLTKIDLDLPNFEVSEEDFQDLSILIKYMLFSMPRLSLPIGANFTKAMKKAMNEVGGSSEQIKMVFFPTLEQRKILDSKKLVLLGPWGSGKTLLMIDQAQKLSKQGQKVLFGVVRMSWFFKSKMEPLILFDLELKFENDPQIDVKLIPIKRYWQTNNLRKMTENYSCLIVDEAPDSWQIWPDYFFGFCDFLAKQECKSVMKSKEVCWVALSNETFSRKTLLKLFYAVLGLEKPKTA